MPISRRLASASRRLVRQAKSRPKTTAASGLALGAFATLVFVACTHGGGESSGVGAGSTSDGGVVQPKSNVVVVSPVDMLAAQRTSATQLVFPKNAASVAQARVGDYLLGGAATSGTQAAAQVAVTAVGTDASGNLVFTVSDAPFDAPIASGAFTRALSVDSGDVDSASLATGVSVGQSAPLLVEGTEAALQVVSLETVLDTVTIYSSGAAYLTLKGSLDLSPSITLTGKFDTSGGGATEFALSGDVACSASLQVSADFQGTLQAEKQLYKCRRYVLLNVGVPLLVRVDVRVFAGFDGDLQAKLAYTAGMTGSAKAGVTWAKVAGWKRVDENSLQFSHSLSGSVAGALRVYVRPELEVTPVAVPVSGTLSPELYSRLEGATTTSGAKVCLHGGLKANVGVAFGWFRSGESDYTATVLDKSWLIWGTCPTGPAVSIAPDPLYNNKKPIFALSASGDPDRGYNATLVVPSGYTGGSTVTLTVDIVNDGVRGYDWTTLKFCPASNLDGVVLSAPPTSISSGTTATSSIRINLKGSPQTWTTAFKLQFQAYLGSTFIGSGTESLTFTITEK